MRRTALGLLTALVLLLLPPGAGAAERDDEVRERGACTGGSDWEVRVRGDEQRIEVRGRVDHTRSGRTWRWKIKHNGSISATGRAVARDGELEVRRALVDLAGTDHCVFRAVQPRTGEVCRGAVDW